MIRDHKLQSTLGYDNLIIAILTIILFVAIVHDSQQIHIDIQIVLLKQ